MLAVQMVLKPCVRHSKQPMVLFYMVYEALHMVFKPCARPPKQPIIVGGIAYGFKTMCGEMTQCSFLAK